MNILKTSCRRIEFGFHARERLSRHVLFMSAFAFFIFVSEQMSENANAQGYPHPFEQDPLPDGVISIEAEHYHAHTSVTNDSIIHTWNLVPGTMYSGGAAMRAMPNTGLRNNGNFVTNSPRLDYHVNFHKSGVHYIVGRGASESHDDNSFHAGIDGAGNTTSDRIDNPVNALNPVWSGETMDFNIELQESELAFFDVPSPGERTINIWMREDGFILDKFVISTSPNVLPTGFGPAESSQGRINSVRWPGG